MRMGRGRLMWERLWRRSKPSASPSAGARAQHILGSDSCLRCTFVHFVFTPGAFGTWEWAGNGQGPSGLQARSSLSCLGFYNLFVPLWPDLGRGLWGFQQHCSELPSP